MGYPPMEISLNHIQEEETIIAVVLIFILGFVGVVLLVEVVLWRVGVPLSSEPLQICQHQHRRPPASSSPSTSVSTSVGSVSASVSSCSSPVSKQLSMSDPSLSEEELGVGDDAYRLDQPKGMTAVTIKGKEARPKM
jgi:cytoskeletal protein RodZ